MAQPGNFTPILLYSSSTSTNVPLAANLTNSTNGAELAINIADKNLFFKDSTNAVNTVPIRQSGTSSNGWLSATDWNTFNSKAPATSGTSLLYGNGSGGFSNVTIGSGISFTGGTLSATGSGGTVTSVTGTSPVVSSGGTTPAISLATAYGDTLNPYASKTAKYVLAAPNATTGVPTFRQLANTDITGLGTMSTQNANSVAITGGTLNGVAIGGTTAGDGTFDVLTGNTSRLGIATGTSFVATNGLSSTSTFTGTAPTDGIVIDYSTGYGRFSAFTGDGYQWYTGGIGTTKIMDLSSAGALVTSGTVTANGVLLTGNLGTVTSVTGTSPVVSSGGTTPAISMPAATTSVSGYLTSTDWNTFNNKGNGTVTSVSGTTGRITSTGGTTPVIDLASGVATAGTTGSSTLIPVVTIDTYGRVTSITTAANPQGTVTSVTGTAPVVSSGGATPAISMAAATGSVNGYLTSTDWTTFNNKGSGTVTSVAATVPAFLSISGSPITNSGTLAITLSGTALPVANGGTGLTSLTAGYIPYGNGTSAFGSSSGLSFDGTNLSVIGAISSAQLLNTAGTITAAALGSGTADITVGTGTFTGATVTVAGYGSSGSANITGMWIVGGFCNTSGNTLVTQINNTVSATGTMSLAFQSSGVVRLTLTNIDPTNTKYLVYSVIRYKA